jgi:hypothetical protein
MTIQRLTIGLDYAANGYDYRMNCLGKIDRL